MFSRFKDIQWVTKKKHIQLFLKLMSFTYISETTWATKNLFTFIRILVWRDFRCKKNFSNTVTQSADVCKNALLPEKSKLLKKIHYFEKFKNFFSSFFIFHLKALQTRMRINVNNFSVAQIVPDIYLKSTSFKNS